MKTGQIGMLSIHKKEISRHDFLLIQEPQDDRHTIQIHLGL